MKKINNLAWMSAIALAGAMGFTACSSDDDTMENVNPSYNGESVKTQFAINVPKAAKTRQSAAITQNESNFRGMEEITLVPMTTTPTENAPGVPAQDLIELPKYDDFDGNSANYKLYNDVNIKVGVNHFLFYGQAIGTAAASSIDAKLTNGVLTKAIDNADNANTTMSLEKIHTTTLTNTTLLGYLNGIVGANANWTGDDNSTTSSSHMGILYNNFTGLTAGSANSILKAVEKLYNSVAPLAGDNNSDKTSQAGISYDIKAKIEQLFKVVSSTSNNVTTYTLSYKDDEAIANKNFPTNLGLPEGAARLTFANDVFSYETTALGGNNNAINVGTICYPAALNYFASTPVKVTDSEMTSWPNTAAGWTSYAWTGWTDKVLPTTRTIALKDNINYGVALLKTTLKTAATLADNSASQGGATADKVITNDGSSDKFALTGVLVGGQPTAAKWNFLPAPTASFDNTIWDGKMNGTINVNTAQSTGNYTMVLDNTAGEKQKVNIAVELQNNTGEEFYGIDGVVPAGGKFYLVAQLDPASTTNGEVSGSSDVVNRVFLKDYTTTANLTINSLKNAYVTIPDLRSTKLQLGLSVDLEWQAGLTFNVTIQ